MGAGSNVLFEDRTFEGVIIKLGNKFSNISQLNQNVLVAGSATLDKKLSEFAKEKIVRKRDGKIKKTEILEEFKTWYIMNYGRNNLPNATKSFLVISNCSSISETLCKFILAI